MLMVFSGCSSTDPNKQNIGIRFQEPEEQLPISPAQHWEYVKPGLNIAWGSSNDRYHREYKPEVSGEEVSLTAWKGERVYAQMVAWANDSVNDVTFEIGDLTSDESVISNESIKYFFVRNVISDRYFSCATAGNKDPDYTQLVADVLTEAKAYNMRSKSTRGIWFNVDVPADAISGEYISIIDVWAQGQKVKSLKLNLKVQNHILPKPKDWKLHLDIWQNPYAVARYHQVEPWSDAHFEKMAPLYKILAEAGEKCITATIMNRPWGHQTYDPFGSMVKHTLKKDGTWDFDYTIFDKWVSFMMDLGIDRQINCYTMVPWEYKYGYFDEASNQYTAIEANPTSKEYADYWRPFLISFKSHLESKGWFDKTTIAMDERPMEEMKSAFQLIEEHFGGKVASSANYEPKYSDKIYDFSVIINFDVPQEMLDRRKKKGLLTTYYVCCMPEYPNNFTFSPPAEGVWQGWFAHAKGFDGILRWAFNSWNENPLWDTRNDRWAAGDAYLVYPDLSSSIRFEKMREGFQDFEKLRIISEKLEKENTPESEEKLLRLNQLLREFEIVQIEKEGAEALVDRAKILMEQLSE